MSILVVGSVGLDTVETPFGRVEEVLGGAASYFVTAASLYQQVNLVAVVGADFPQVFLDFWRSRPISLEGLQIYPGRTFRWFARYHQDMNLRDTLDTQLGVYADFHPRLPASYLESQLLFVANIQPELQLESLQLAPRMRLTVLDTSEIWILTTRPQLTRAIQQVDMLLMSEEEVRQYTGRTSVLAGVRELLALGLKYVVVKQGSYGALLFGADGTCFAAPTFPLEELRDPTGAGDSFAGGLLGYLSTVEPLADGRYSPDDLKRAVVHGNLIGSFTCEDFGVKRLSTLTLDEVTARYQQLVQYSHFEPSWRR